jgi:hypothetical protein
MMARPSVSAAHYLKLALDHRIDFFLRMEVLANGFRISQVPDTA